jgi:hypothetical protein
MGLIQARAEVAVVASVKLINQSIISIIIIHARAKVAGAAQINHQSIIIVIITIQARAEVAVAAPIKLID